MDFFLLAVDSSGNDCFEAVLEFFFLDLEVVFGWNAVVEGAFEESGFEDLVIEVIGFGKQVKEFLPYFTVSRVELEKEVLVS